MSPAVPMGPFVGTLAWQPWVLGDSVGDTAVPVPSLLPLRMLGNSVGDSV